MKTDTQEPPLTSNALKWSIFLGSYTSSDGRSFMKISLYEIGRNFSLALPKQCFVHKFILVIPLLIIPDDKKIGQKETNSNKIKIHWLG